ncbi:MAG: ABC transporter ATP-binding protein [Bacteroidetes bacterium]|nr:MAG: ABC transporter ATP-binding protein [Bacteroidota bacterium]
MTTEIFIKDLTKKYPKGPEALRGIHLEVGKGQLFTLLGPNGAGKSTLVKIITTLIQPDSGEFTIGGQNPDKEFSNTRNYIGVASQDNELDPAEKVEDLLRFQGRLFGLSKPQARQRAEELIDAFELQSERQKKCETLSGGNKRRLHCALALVHRPHVLFLDEPTVGMDPEARARFWQVINQINKNDGVTIFLTTQYLEEADKHATEMALIMDGTIHYRGSVSEFKEMVNAGQKLTLEESYLTYVGQSRQPETPLQKLEVPQGLNS